MNRTEVDALTVDREIVKSVIAELGPSVAAIVAGDGRVVFTGTFVEHEGTVFVITARHCLEDLYDRRSVLVHSTASAQPIGVEGVEAWIWSTSPEDRLDQGTRPRIDIGAVVLRGDAAKKLKPRCLSLDRVDSKRLNQHCALLLIGFPRERALVKEHGGSVASIELRPFGFVSPSDTSCSAVLSYDVKRHVDMFLEYPAAGFVQVATGEDLPSCDPRGLSGGGVFAINTVKGDELWSAGSLPMVGVQSSHLSKSERLWATRSEYARRLMQDYFERRNNKPELKPGEAFGIEHRPMPTEQH